MELITGTAGHPHVTSMQHRAIFEKIIGRNSYILDDNEYLEPELQSNQSLRIRSGMLCHHGSISEIKRNTYDEVMIANGSQGMKRIDLVVARYTKNPETEIEAMTWVVIQGTPATSNPVTPVYTHGNMQEGDLIDDCPVFEVHLDGIQVTEIKKLLSVLSGNLAELNSKIAYSADKHAILGRWESSWNLSTTAKNIGSKLAAMDNEYYTVTTGADATITIKQAGLYFVSMYTQGMAASGASAGIESSVTANTTIIDDNYVLFDNQYSYNGISANNNIGRVVYLPADTALTAQIRKTASSGTASTSGSSYMEVIKLS